MIKISTLKSYNFCNSIFIMKHDEKILEPIQQLEMYAELEMRKIGPHPDNTNSKRWCFEMLLGMRCYCHIGFVKPL